VSEAGGALTSCHDERVSAPTPPARGSNLSLGGPLGRYWLGIPWVNDPNEGVMPERYTGITVPATPPSS
jgi:hypothetical protein